MNDVVIIEKSRRKFVRKVNRKLAGRYVQEIYRRKKRYFAHLCVSDKRDIGFKS
jgi:hypothetical protein